MGKKQIIIIIAVAVVFGAGGFFGGMKYQQSKVRTFSVQNIGNFNTGQRQVFFNSGGRSSGNVSARNIGNFVGGAIIAKDDKSITVKAPDGSSKIVFYSASTQINKPTTVDASQLNNGENVIVTGNTNSDGSVTASNIQIRPESQLMPGVPVQIAPSQGR